LILTHSLQFNGILINEHDRKLAKQEFQLFDKILSIQNVFTKKSPLMQNANAAQRQELRKLSKKHGEFAGEWLQGIVDEVCEGSVDRGDVEMQLFCAVKDTVQETTRELVGDRQLEKQMKKSCIKYVHA
jgi:hypothetical protein